MKSFLKYLIVTILSFQAKHVVRKTQPYIIAITGSVGKTSTKDAIYEVVKHVAYVRKSDKSFNSEIGVPLTILGLRNAWSNPILWCKNIIDGCILMFFPGKYPDILILEMGVDRPGDMDHLTAWIKPDVVVITRLPEVPVHVEYFSTPEAVVEEKLKLLQALKPEGHFIYNQDDEYLSRVAQTTYQKSIGYSRYAHAVFMAQGDEVLYEDSRPVGISFTLSHMQEQEKISLMGTVGIPHTYVCAAAAAVGHICGVSLKVAAERLTKLESPNGRMRLIEGIKNTTLIDDTYNSSPIAVEQSLKTLHDLRGVKRRIAVLGDMMELGQFSIREHERIGKIVSQTCHMLITVGVRARGFAKGAREAGLNEKNILEFDSAERCGDMLQNIITEGDVILLKGSQSMRLETTVCAVMAHPESADIFLVRQGRGWTS